MGGCEGGGGQRGGGWGGEALRDLSSWSLTKYLVKIKINIFTNLFFFYKK